MWAQLYKGTESELMLEAAVATLGVPYRTNFPCHNYLPRIAHFPDFLLPTLGLVIEVDGDEHRTLAGRRKDAERSELMTHEHGWTVVRCTNEEALYEPADTLDHLLFIAGINLKTDRAKLGPSVGKSLPRCRR